LGQWNLHALTIQMPQAGRLVEGAAGFGVAGLAAGRTLGLHALGHEQVQGGAFELVRRRETAAPGLVFCGEAGEALGHADPSLHELRGPRIGAGGRRRAQGLAHIHDLSDLRAALQRHRDREIPDVVGKVFE